MELKSNRSLNVIFVYTLLACLLVVVLYETFTARYNIPFSSLLVTLSRARLARDRVRGLQSRPQGLHPSTRGDFNESPGPQKLQNAKEGNTGAWSKQTKANKADEEAAKEEIPGEEEAETVAMLLPSYVGETDGNFSTPVNQTSVVKELIKLKTCVLLRAFTGRLGNVMFEFASAVCIAWQNNLTLILNNASELKDFKYKELVLTKEAFEELRLRLPRKNHYERACCSFDKTLMKLANSGICSHSLQGYTQSWKYFEPCKQRVKQAMTFTDDIVTRAVTIVDSLRKRFPDRTLVGVHIRMEDYLSERAVSNGKRTAPPDYYIKAMTYFRKRFDDVTFVIITKDPDYIRANVTTASDVTFLKRSDSPTVDMEVLSRLDHLIISVGTFGWWAAYKSKGVVVHYKDFYVPGSRYGKQFSNNASDFIYPGWITL
ncbi:hypothetical protein V1264_017434 [Littorina saxatilis]|uniref:L-Fucosyltransferase n=1 Tax=Littorina saxatilis TaxID=31220 RepID=A0AAN9GEL2_9CAEN